MRSKDLSEDIEMPSRSFLRLKASSYGIWLYVYDQPPKRLCVESDYDHISSLIMTASPSRLCRHFDHLSIQFRLNPTNQSIPKQFELKSADGTFHVIHNRHFVPDHLWRDFDVFDSKSHQYWVPNEDSKHHPSLDRHHVIAVTHSLDGIRGNLSAPSQCLSLSVHSHYDHIQLHFRRDFGPKANSKMGYSNHSVLC